MSMTVGRERDNIHSPEVFGEKEKCKKSIDILELNADLIVPLGTVPLMFLSEIKPS